MNSGILVSEYLEPQRWIPSDWRTILAIFIGLFSCFWLYQEFRFKVIKKRINLNGPKPWPIVGNLIELFSNTRVITSEKWGEKYGKMYVIFSGKHPVVCCEDVDVVKEIAIKDFEIFPNHDVPGFVKETEFAKNLFMLQDEEWKEARALMSPTFTSNKIKRMYKLLDDCSNDLISCFNEQIDNKNQDSKNGKENGWSLLRSKDTYKLFTLNTISTCCYALKLERSKGELNFDKNSSRNKVAEVIDFLFMADKTIIFRAILPKFFSKFLPRQKSQICNDLLANILLPVIKQRKNKPGYYDDYMSILIDARLGDALELTTSDSLENHHANLTSDSLHADQNKMKQVAMSRSNNLAMSESKILANAILFMAAGMETTSTLLRNITYCLAFHPDVQQKLYEEIKKIPLVREGKNSYLDYEKLTACEYLDSVICESLRRLIPFTAMTRVAKEDYYIEKYNVSIPKGTVVDLVYGRLHLDPDYWTEPEKFDPERFMPQNRSKIIPGSYSPFGQGPRYCIGMRFSLTETKLAVAKVVLNFEIKPIPGSPWPPQPIYGSASNIYHPSDVLVRRRF